MALAINRAQPSLWQAISGKRRNCRKVKHLSAIALNYCCTAVHTAVPTAQIWKAQHRTAWESATRVRRGTL